VQRPYNPNARRIAELMQADLAKIGVTAEIRSFEWGEYRKRAQAGDKPVRLAAIHALAEIGHRSALPAFRELLADGDREIVRAAQESFASMQGKEVDAAVLALLSAADKNQQLAGIELIGRRRMVSSLPALLKAARESDVTIRPAALKQVGELGTPELAPAVIEILQASKTEQELEAAEQTLGALCAKAPNPEACVEKLQPAMAQAQPAQKGALLRVLSTIGGAQALKAVRATVSDASPAVRDAAIRALGAWKTAEAGPDLLALAKDSSNPAEKMLCLRSFLALMANSELPANQRLTLCRDAAGLLQGADEKKMLLAALGGITAPEALEVITPYLSDPATREEAGAAALGISERLLRPRNAKVSPKLLQALEKVGAAQLSPASLQRAKTLLDQAKKKAGGT
jgi:HEAT repeat protein